MATRRRKSSLTDPATWREALIAELAAIVQHGDSDAARVSAAKQLAGLHGEAGAEQKPPADRLDELASRRTRRRKAA